MPMTGCRFDTMAESGYLESIYMLTSAGESGRLSVNFSHSFSPAASMEPAYTASVQ